MTEESLYPADTAALHEHSRPTVSMGTMLMDSTYCGLEIFRKKKGTLLLTSILGSYAYDGQICTERVQTFFLVIIP